MSISAGRTVWVDYMRSIVVVLVVAHHAALAYTTFSVFDTAHYINSTHPVVDNQRWKGLDVLVGYNDLFFMPLMFLISGLFVYKAIARKGKVLFFKDRLIRLGIPFIIAELTIIPLSYLPSYYLVHHQIDLSDFLYDYIVNQYWPVGPPWFLWLLLVFNMVALLMPAAWYRLVSKRVIWILYPTSLVAYLPITLWVGPYNWTGWMVFDFQLNRVFLYLVYYLAGVAMGAGSWEKELFTNNKLLNKPWPVWVVSSVVLFVVSASMRGNLPATHSLFVLTCLIACLGCMAFFKWIIQSERNFWNNLSANAYGIYLVHYFFITWFQFALLSIPIPAIVKFFIVLVFSLIASWLIVNWIRMATFFKKLL
jgi:Fucose 4-O-acetylase and related acetyltransferases